MKKHIILSLVFLIFIIGIISCAGNKNDGTITLEWWHFWTDPVIKPIIEKIVTDYETANPGIKINLTDLTWANGHEKIVVAFSSGTAPDIVELGSDWVPEFSYIGQLAEMPEKITGDTSKFHGWSAGIFNDTIYAWPWILGTRVLFLNRDLLNRAGFDSVFVPINWPDLKKACMAIDSLGKDIYGFGSNAAEKHRLYKKFLPFFWSMDGRIISRDGKYCVFSSDKAYKALNFYKELHDSCSLVDTQRRLEDAFLDGKVGVIISGDWLLKRIRNEKRDIDFVTSIIPGPEYPGKSFAGGEYLAVSSISPHKDEAAKFIRYVTNKENQLAFCKTNYSASPSNRETAEDEFFKIDPNLQTFVMQLNLSRMTKPHPKWVYIEEIVESTIEDVLFEDAPIAESLYEAQIRIQKIIDKQ